MDRVRKKPVKTPSRWDTSYGLKHVPEDVLGFDVSIGQLKGAMLKAGYEPADPQELNWRFCARLRSWRRVVATDRAEQTGYTLEPHESRELRLILGK